MSLELALVASSAPRIEPAEQEWIEKIEAIRERLGRSQERVSFVDYGAGAPGARLSRDVMRTGRRREATIGEICRTSSKCRAAATFLFRLVRLTRPRSCLELGTCVGISAAYQAAALHLNGAGRLVTLEGGAALAAIAAATLAELGLGDVELVTGRFEDTLAGAIEGAGPFDLVFLDGHHDEEATVGYARCLFPALAAGGLLVLDDIRWSEGMQRAWRTLQREPQVEASVDLADMGILQAR